MPHKVGLTRAFLQSSLKLGCGCLAAYSLSQLYSDCTKRGLPTANRKLSLLCAPIRDCSLPAPLDNLLIHYFSATLKPSPPEFHGNTAVNRA